jgi:hypothetical protein
MLPYLLILWTTLNSPDPSSLTCSAVDAAHKTTVNVAIPFASMAGTVTVDGPSDVRRLKVKAVPYAATYSLTFQSYDAGDKKPAAEALKPQTAVVGRLVAFGDVMHVFFDVDVKLASGATELICK